MLPILIGSKSDLVFMADGLKHLDRLQVCYEVVVSSTHREPRQTSDKILALLTEHKDIKVMIAGANAAGGLPGVLAGYLLDTNIVPIGVRFSHDPGQALIEDASFVLSSLPRGVPLLYAGFNSKGFEHACILAARILGGV